MISEYFTDEELMSELAMFFTSDEDIDFKTYLGQVKPVDEDTSEIKIGERVFRFDNILCGVEEVQE